MMKKVLLFLLVAPLVFADQTMIPHNLTNGSVADAAKVQRCKGAKVQRCKRILTCWPLSLMKMTLG